MSDVLTGLIDCYPLMAKFILPSIEMHRLIMNQVREKNLFSEEILPVVHSNFKYLLELYKESVGLSSLDVENGKANYYPLSWLEISDLNSCPAYESLSLISRYGINTINQAVTNACESGSYSASTRNYLRLNGSNITGIVKRAFQNAFIISLEWAELSNTLAQEKGLHPIAVYKANTGNFFRLGAIGEDRFQEITQACGHRMLTGDDGDLIIQSFEKHSFFLDNNNSIRFANPDFDKSLPKVGTCPAYNVPEFIKDFSGWTNNVLDAYYWKNVNI